jgi:hypothetical protein
VLHSELGQNVETQVYFEFNCKRSDAHDSVCLYRTEVTSVAFGAQINGTVSETLAAVPFRICL